MKRITMLFLAASLTFAAGSTIAQTDKKDNKKLERAERKKQKEEQFKANQERFLSAVKDRSFVIEADAISGKYNFRHQVTSSTNFVKIDGEEVTIQSAGGTNPGYNGLGGLTVNGRITDYDVTTSDKSHSINIAVMFTSPVIGHSSLILSIRADGYASATVSDNWGGRATFNGEFVELENSRTFEGMSII